MKILMLTHRVPWPLQSGDRIRTFNFFNYLSEKHEVAILSFSDARAGIEEDRRHLQPKCELIETVPMDYTLAKVRGATAIFSREPISVRAFYSQPFANAFRRIVESFKPDCVVTDSSVLAQYPLMMNLPFYADFMDVDSEKWRQISVYSKWPLNWVYLMESHRLARYEQEVALKAQGVFVVSETEKARLLALAPQARVGVIPNGVDRNIFQPSDKKPIPARLVFVGVMNYFPNADAVIWFCREIWPKILKQVHAASLYIVGANPSFSVRALKRLTGVEVTGSVLDVRQYYTQAEVCVAPLRFSIGLQNKVIQSMAMGKAVVSTTGAVQGLAGNPAEAVRIANTAGEFAASVIEFLQHPEQRKKYEEAGPHFVAKYHDWNANLQMLRNYF